MKEKLEEARVIYETASEETKRALESLFPELKVKENKDKRIIGRIIEEKQKPIEVAAKEVTQNKESATKFLKSAGIMDENGELAEIYRSEQQSFSTEETKLNSTTFLEKLGYKCIPPEGEKKPAEWSEDERIRNMLKNLLRNAVLSEFIPESSYREMLAYLEKQKEQEPSSYSHLEITNVVRKALQECEGFKNCRADVYAARVGATVEGLLREQQPAEWSEEVINATISSVDEWGKECAGLKNRLKPLRPQPKQEWGEEDEENFELLHTCVCHCINDPYWDYDKREKVSKEIIPFLDRLKSLSLHPNQEWSEEDEEMFRLTDSVIWNGERLDQGDAGKVCRWLKSLHDRITK